MKGFDFDVAKAEQIFDLLLKEKQLKLPENHKLPMTQELQGRPYCKWHHSFPHPTNDCKEPCRQIKSAIEQGRLILAQHTMKVDSQPFPQANMVELSDFRLRARTWHSRLTWWDPCAAMTSRGKMPLLANGPRMKTSRSSNMLLKNKCVTSAINFQVPIGF